ncbi:MAG TPA: virion tegument protein [Clostridiales bacterium]|nr:virion tegument protein [Clostridiales bacterium]
MEFDAIWTNIINHAGEQFFTKTKLPFTYKIVSNCVVPDRTNYPINKADFEKAAKITPLHGPGQINSLVRGPAYVYAILTDKRIR